MVQKELELVKKYQQHEKDCGSIEVQVVQLTGRIGQLTQHAIANKKDHSSKRGLVKAVERRRRFLTYLRKHNKSVYQELIKELGLRK